MPKAIIVFKQLLSKAGLTAANDTINFWMKCNDCRKEQIYTPVKQQILTEKKQNRLNTVH